MDLTGVDSMPVTFTIEINNPMVVVLAPYQA